MLKLKWVTLSRNKYVADSPMGTRVEIVMRREETSMGWADKGFDLYVGNVTLRTHITGRHRAKQRAEAVYCDAVSSEFNRVCK